MLTKANLDQFTGSVDFFRHSLMPSIVYTEGVKYMADEGGAHWLVDKIATLQLDPKVKPEEFQVWRLMRRSNNTAYLACEDGNHKEVYRELIDYTDFPLDEIELWYVNQTIMLPSEY